MLELLPMTQICAPRINFIELILFLAMPSDMGNNIEQYRKSHDEEEDKSIIFAFR
jgi:hypothetical protein